MQIGVKMQATQQERNSYCAIAEDQALKGFRNDNLQLFFVHLVKTLDVFLVFNEVLTRFVLKKQLFKSMCFKKTDLHAHMLQKVTGLD